MNRYVVWSISREAMEKESMPKRNLEDHIGIGFDGMAYENIKIGDRVRVEINPRTGTAGVYLR